MTDENSSEESAPTRQMGVSDVEDILRELAEISEQAGLVSLGKEVREDRIPSLLGGRVTVVVLGEFNHGKSSMINAMLGGEVLPVGITPTTAVITHLVYGEEPGVSVKYPGDSIPRVRPYSELAEVVRNIEEEGREPQYVEVRYPNAWLDQSVTLVDTPGVNDISRQRVEITYGYVPRADLILYVLDATQVLKKSEVVFIRDKLLKGNRERILFILGKIDALTEDEAAEVESYARQRLGELIGPVDLFPCSAQMALEARESGEDLPEGFAKFQSYLEEFVRVQRSYIVLDSALAGGLRIAALLDQNLAIKKHSYGLELSVLDSKVSAVRSKLQASRRLIAENLDRIEESVGGIAATARHNLRAFEAEFVEALPIQIERADARQLKRYLPSFVQDRFKEWLETEGNEIAGKLEDLATEIIEITNASMKDAVETLQAEMGTRGEIDLDVDTMAYDVGVYALGAFGVSVFLFANALVGGMLTLAAPVLAFVLRDRVDAKIKARAREEGLAAIGKATDIVEEELLRVIGDYGTSLRMFVENAGDRLYCQIEEVLQQVLEDRRNNGDGDLSGRIEAVESKRVEVQRIVQLIRVGRKHLVEDWET
jgi:ribosome biogenesis GTPase A